MLIECLSFNFTFGKLSLGQWFRTLNRTRKRLFGRFIFQRYSNCSPFWCIPVRLIIAKRTMLFPSILLQDNNYNNLDSDNLLVSRIVTALHLLVLKEDKEIVTQNFAVLCLYFSLNLRTRYCISCYKIQIKFILLSQGNLQALISRSQKSFEPHGDCR